MTPSDLIPSVKKVLNDSKHGLTSYQILNVIPEKEDAIVAFGDSGKDAGHYYGAATAVAHAAAQLVANGEAEKSYIHTEGMMFNMGNGSVIRPGNAVCALFRKA